MAENRGVSRRLQRSHRYGSFGDRYPDYVNWLNGDLWALDYDVDIKAPIEGFRAALHYQAKAQGLNLVTKTEKQFNENGGLVRKVLLVQSDAKSDQYQAWANQ